MTAMTQGGLVFKRFEGVVLDAGWGRGEVAFRKFPDAESTFMDRRRPHLQRAEPGGLQLRGPAPPRPGARERRRARARFLIGALRTGVRRRAGSSAGPRRADVSVLEPPSTVAAARRGRPQPPAELRRAPAGARGPESAGVRWPSSSYSSPVHQHVVHALGGLAPVSRTSRGRRSGPRRRRRDRRPCRVGSSPRSPSPSRRAGWAARCCTASSSVHVRAPARSARDSGRSTPSRGDAAARPRRCRRSRPSWPDGA